MLSSRLVMSLARLLRPWAVKKLVGLSRAELTLLPVAKRFWVVESRSAVDCSESRFWRTDAERTMPDIDVYLSGIDEHNRTTDTGRTTVALVLRLATARGSCGR